MSNIDLDINNYSVSDLEQFLKLKKKYAPKDVDYQEAYIREQLLSSGHIHPRFKSDFIEFLQLAKDRILTARFGPSDNVPTQIPKNWKLDPLDTPLSKEPMSREQELVSHPNNTFVQSMQSEFYAGTLNPLNTRIISKYLTIDTRFRENLSSKTSDFTVQLPTRMNKVVSMQLSALEMPLTFYGISSTYGNNFLYIFASQQFVIDGPLTDSDIVVIIPDGNYTSADLVKKINDLLAPLDDAGNLAEPDSVFSFIHLALDVNQDGSGSGKVTIQPAYNTPLGTSIKCLGLDFRRNISGERDNVDITTKLGWNLGYTSATYCGSPYYVADTPIQTASMKYVYLAIDDYQHNVNKLFLTAYHNTNLNENILARISLKTANFTTLMENNYKLITEPRTYFGPVDVQKLRIQLFDDHGRPLNTNSANYSFVLLFKMVYDL